MKFAAVSSSSWRLALSAVLVGSLVFGFGLNAWTGGAPMLVLSQPLDWLVLRCPTLTLFNVICPTCGLGRALIYAWTGHWQLSWQFHPGGLLLLIMAVSLAVAAWLPGLSWRSAWRSAWRELLAWGRARPWIGMTLVALYCLWGFTRDLPF